MSNLENLTQKILKDGKQGALIIEEESLNKNQEIINSKIQKANEKREEILGKVNKEAIMLKDRRISEAELSSRDEKLIAKRNVLDSVFTMAKENLKNIGEDDYVSFLKGQLSKMTLSGSEILVVPDKFKNKVKNIGLHLKISDEESVDSGFLIKDKNVVINYSFDALVDFISEDIEGEIAKELFEE